MPDEPDHLVLRMLRQMDTKLDRIVEDVGDLKRRMTSIEGQVSLLHGDFANQSIRIDRIEGRLDRIERRLDLTEVATA
jgi:hypothetical protein